MADQEYLGIVIKGVPERKNLAAYFYRSYRKASEHYYSSEEFFATLKNLILDLLATIEKEKVEAINWEERWVNVPMGSFISQTPNIILTIAEKKSDISSSHDSLDLSYLKEAQVAVEVAERQSLIGIANPSDQEELDYISTSNGEVNDSNRLILLKELGVIDYLIQKYPSQLANNKKNIQFLLKLILVPKITEKSFGATVRYLLNNTGTISTGKGLAINKLNAELAKIDISLNTKHKRKTKKS